MFSVFSSFERSGASICFRWNRFRTLCDSNKKIGVVLEVTADLPPDDVIDRWFGEPIKAAVLSTNLFLTNKKGFPVLSRAHQNVVKRIFKVIKI